MSYQDWTEADIQALKAQEAKDLAVELLHEIDVKEAGPISPGEVQLRELEYELKIKQAEIEDATNQREHEKHLRELEIELERERSKAAESHSEADRIRDELRQLIDRVRHSEESLSTQLERATREHRLKIEQMEHDFATRRSELEVEQQGKMEECERLKERITELIEMETSADNLSTARLAVEAKQAELDCKSEQLDDEIATLEFVRKKRVSEVTQAQDLELAKLQFEHEKQLLSLNRQAADQLLESLELKAIKPETLDELHAEIERLRTDASSQNQASEAEIRERLRREFNITTSDPVDVTELFYRCRSHEEQLGRLREQIGKLENELSAARLHIQGEPQRIATAVEAARTPIQNIVEPAGKR
ncbi:MAG: hypothetical protein AAFV88_09445 [Planctomycetota bacterium]